MTREERIALHAARVADAIATRPSPCGPKGKACVQILPSGEAKTFRRIKDAAAFAGIGQSSIYTLLRRSRIQKGFEWRCGVPALDPTPTPLGASGH
jgi:hypothetical protein